MAFVRHQSGFQFVQPPGEVYEFRAAFRRQGHHQISVDGVKGVGEIEEYDCQTFCTNFMYELAHRVHANLVSTL